MLVVSIVFVISGCFRGLFVRALVALGKHIDVVVGSVPDLHYQKEIRLVVHSFVALQYRVPDTHNSVV